MSENILPPALPEDASKSTISPSPNIRETGASKILSISITGCITETKISTDATLPFLWFAAGTLARAARASITVTGAELPGIYVKFTYPLASTWTEAQLLLARYYYQIYTLIISGHTSLPYHPRNVGFCLMALARNRVCSVGGQINLYVYNDSTTVPLTDAQMDSISTFIRHSALGYDLVNVPVYESGPFPSSKLENAKDPVKEVKLSVDTIGSVYTTYDDASSTYYDYYTEDVSTATWWLKAALANKANAPTGAVATASWSNIAVYPAMLAAWVSYSDTVCDVPYVFTSQNYFPKNAVTADAEGVNQPVEPYNTMISFWSNMYTVNDEQPLGVLFQNQTQWSIWFHVIYNYVTCLYSPFGQIMNEFLYPTPDADQGDTAPWTRLLFSANWRTPIFMPSILSETLASIAEQTILKTTQDGLTRSMQVFHIATWPLTTAGEKTSFTDLNTLVTIIDNFEYLLNYRRFIKLSMNPEYKVNKAVMPYFFLHVPVNKSIVLPGQTVIEAFDAIVSPYSTRYIEDHNLHLLARCMPWPRVFNISQPMVAWLPIIDLKPLEADGAGWDALLKPFDLATFSLLCIDISYMADGCEMDAYLNKMRTTHLGFFAALAGLLPTALKVGTALFKTIVKPKDIDHATEPAPTASTGPSVSAAQTNNMAMAGVSSLQQTMSGQPGSGGTVDLSSTVNVDPIQHILEAGKRVTTNKHIKQAITFGGKAIKFGRQFYHNYQKS